MKLNTVKCIIFLSTATKMQKLIYVPFCLFRVLHPFPARCGIFKPTGQYYVNDYILGQYFKIHTPHPDCDAHLWRLHRAHFLLEELRRRQAITNKNRFFNLATHNHAGSPAP
jgi:hypothetical protein